MPDDTEREEMLDRIEQDTIQLDAMLERILTVSRLESGQLKPHFEPLSLNDLVDDVLHDASSKRRQPTPPSPVHNFENIQVYG